MIMKKKKTVVKTPTVIDTPKENTSPTKTPLQRVVQPKVMKHDSDSMRDLFFIVKGQYKKGVEPSFVNGVTNDVSFLGGYDPDNPDTPEWYMCMDKVTFHCTACGSDLNSVVHSVYTQIMKYKGSAKKYFKHVSDTTSDDYYETYYLGHSPLSTDQRNKKAEGRCPRTSPAMRCLYDAIYNWYGDHFSDLVQEMEDQAYRDLEEVIRESKPLNKTRKIMKKTPVKRVEVETPVTPLKEVGATPKKFGKIKRGVKKLVMK